MALHVVLGKGPVGTAVTQELRGQGHDVRVLSRSGGGPAGDGVEHRAVDAADTRALAQASAGAAALYNCANPPYDQWERQWPPVAHALLDAAEQTGAVLVTMGNLYVYGPVDGPMTEQTPLAAPGRKGRVRVRMWQQALARSEAGALRVTEARASDFVGPGVVATGHLGERVVPRVLAGRGVRVIGSADQPHSWTSVRDVGRTLAVLGTDPRAWGRAWHVPTAAPLTQREAVAALCRAAGVPPVRVGTVPHLALRAAGLAVPFLRELEEVRHQFTAPFVLDSAAATRTFGLEPTPLEEVWTETVAWWRAREAVAA